MCKENKNSNFTQFFFISSSSPLAIIVKLCYYIKHAVLWAWALFMSRGGMHEHMLNYGWNSDATLMMFYYVSVLWPWKYPCSLWRVRKFSDFINNIFICVPKMNLRSYAFRTAWGWVIKTNENICNKTWEVYVSSLKVQVTKKVGFHKMNPYELSG